MISSPPQEAEHVRGKSLTPESPRPQHLPSPSNIPILEKQMDPMFNESSLSIGTPASFQSYTQQNQTPRVQSSASYYTDQQGTSNYQNAAGNGVVGAGPNDFSQATAYGGRFGSHTQDTSIQSFPSQNHAPAPSYSEAKSTPVQDTRPAYPYDSNPYPTPQTQAQPAQGTQFQSQANNDGGVVVNFQAILDNLSTAVGNDGANDRNAAPSMPSQPQGHTPISSLPAAPNLPPRPPPQDKPATHPNYNPNDDIRSYHPHNQKPQGVQYRGAGQLPPLNVRGGAGNPQMDGVSASRLNQSPSTPGYGRHSTDLRSASPDDEDARWPPEINKLYEEFLDDERKFVTDGQWDQFPVGSRLFIGNLPTEKVTKRDIFHRFFRHGKLAQISIKQAYGFVQFLDSSSCYKALQAEQGQAVRGRKMHLEISKPQRNTKKADGNTNGARRRSRSPDYTRGGTGQQGQRNDRYGGNQNAMSPRDRDNRRFRDDYRPLRSPSPPRGGRGMRGRDRSRDRYDRKRSRSRSPLGRGGGRYRSPSPRSYSDDDLPLPHRAPPQIPDVQVLVVNDLPRDFIAWVEDAFRQRGLRIDVLILSPRLSEAAVVRRQIVEGVLAIVKLNAATLAKSKVNVQVFDRRGGADNIRFDEYADLDPATAAMLVINAKQTQAQLVQPPVPHLYGHSYSTPPVPTPTYAPQPPPGQYPPTPTNNTPNLSNLISSLDSNGLSQLLGAMSHNNPSQAPPQPPAAGLTSDLARLLGSVSAPPAQPPAYAPRPSQPPQSPQTYPNSYQNPALASLLGGQGPLQPTPPAAPPVQTPTQPSPAGQPDMNEIMAQLAKYQR
ncbi:hypothetical protein K469DRAFT_646961 [Zopfia rhizophila CBS 207.26]|uniref:RRM domain-containing protein n=1 Tax=Zopfia rhizophila CBS 207.26 TaxID=1314779 RepID=A0A6A6DAR5_9PEZI|nr:hypothetical protein K469DRAFT_646961 [Zopfia rhizophila CBS 207.26]